LTATRAVSGLSRRVIHRARASRLPVLVERLRVFQLEGKLDPATDLEKLAATMAAFAFGLGFMQQVVFAEDPDYLDAILASTAQTIARGIGGSVGSGEVS
jgi:hypothetical protein